MTAVGSRRAVSLRSVGADESAQDVHPGQETASHRRQDCHGPARRLMGWRGECWEGGWRGRDRDDTRHRERRRRLPRDFFIYDTI